jgi:hypothetical protein
LHSLELVENEASVRPAEDGLPLPQRRWAMLTVMLAITM